ncbi:lipid II flippase family protein [Clostridium simiarum]
MCINGVATILIFIFIEPFMSMFTEGVLREDCSEEHFDR